MKQNFGLCQPPAVFYFPIFLLWRSLLFYGNMVLGITTMTRLNYGFRKILSTASLVTYSTFTQEWTFSSKHRDEQEILSSWTALLCSLIRSLQNLPFFPEMSPSKICCVSAAQKESVKADGNNRQLGIIDRKQVVAADEGRRLASSFKLLPSAAIYSVQQNAATPKMSVYLQTIEKKKKERRKKTEEKLETFGSAAVLELDSSSSQTLWWINKIKCHSFLSTKKL